MPYTQPSLSLPTTRSLSISAWLPLPEPLAAVRPPMAGTGFRNSHACERRRMVWGYRDPGSTPMTPQLRVTQLLLAWGQGEEAALEELMPLVHDELRRL